MYTDFAQVYDRLMDNVDYEKWAAFYARLMEHYGIRKGRACECACGTGSLTIPLSRHGYQLTGVDLSRDMLWIASQRARKLGMAIPFVQQDMRELRLHRRMDAILATCDGVNYLTEDEDALAFFRAAFQALRPGGGLFFDVSTPYKLQNDLGNNLICEDREDITYFWQNTYSARNRTVSMHLCFFVRDEDGKYARIDEEQVQRAYTAEELTALLTAAGFEKIGFYGDMRPCAPAANERRWHVAALRPEEDETDEDDDD